MSKASSRQCGFWLAVAGALTVTWWIPLQAQARTWYVWADAPSGGDGSPEHPYQTIGQGISSAGDGDTVLVLERIDPSDPYSGPGNRDLFIEHKAITIKSENGPTNCTIDCDGDSTHHRRAFKIGFANTDALHLEGFTIREGYVYIDNEEQGKYRDGGAILNQGSGALTVVNCVFENNHAGRHGGAIYNFTSLHECALINCVFKYNDAGKGGAVAALGGEDDIVNCSFFGNKATIWYGGAVDVDTENSTRFTNCRFTGNYADIGGGAVSCGGFDGGGCGLTFKGCTMHWNRAGTWGGAIHADSGTTVSTVLVMNCILWASTVHSSPPEAFGPEIALMCGAQATVDYSDVTGGLNDVRCDDPNDIEWGENNIDVDPEFVAPGHWEDRENTPDIWGDDVWVDEGTDYNLATGGPGHPPSPCFDAADNVQVPADEFDLDGDADTSERTPLDLDRQLRFADRRPTDPDPGNPDPPDYPYVVDMGAYEWQILGDLDGNGCVDLSDLAMLLPHYRMTSGVVYSDGDLDRDGDVDLSDLAALLGNYGKGCGLGRGGDAESRGPGARGEGDFMRVLIEPYDTGGYQGGGFHGEVDHFVFDLKIEVFDPNDDWTTAGALLDAYNAATFRLSSGPLVPDAYATFIAAPWVEVPTGPNGASTAGAYLPADPTYEFETTGINIAWFDTQDSHDGPATVLRLVIDVSAVEGADVSGGFGSVYFSYWAPAEPGDILVADLRSAATSASGGGELVPLNRRLYVKGEE